MSTIKSSDIKILSFDWEENPNEVIDSFAEVLKWFSISVVEIDTQSDTLVVVIGKKLLTKNEAAEAYNNYLE